MTSTNTNATCFRCRQPVSAGVSFCASCGFDNGETLRQNKQAGLDLQVHERLTWLRFKQMLLGWLRRW